MSETDVLRRLVDGTLAICTVPGCSNTFVPDHGRQRNCGREDCAKYVRDCDGPFCTNKVSRKRTDGSRGGKRWNYCSAECGRRMAALDRHIQGCSPEEVLTFQEAVELVREGDASRNLGKVFAAVQDAAQTGSRTALYYALVAAGASCIAQAAARGRPAETSSGA